MIAYAIGVWAASGVIIAMAAVVFTWFTRPAACGSAFN